MKLRALQALWREFNVRHFDGALKPIVIRVTRSRQLHGKFVALASKAGEEKPSKILLARQTAEEYRDTLLHEMIHQSLCERGIMDEDHGEPFQAEHIRVLGARYVEASDGP